jgi:hypothetical protein
MPGWQPGLVPAVGMAQDVDGSQPRQATSTSVEKQVADELRALMADARAATARPAPAHLRVV